MEKEKISLIKEFNKSNFIKMQTKEEIKNIKQNMIKDERIVKENNKILATTYSALVCILVLGAIIADTINFKINTSSIFIIIGIVSYVGLILMCKKNIIEQNPDASVFFIWSFFTLPISIFNLVDDLFNKYSNSLIIIAIELVISIIITIILYKIANLIYKNSVNKNKES